MKKYTMHYITHEGEVLDTDKVEGISWKMKNLLNGRENAMDYQTDNMLKVYKDTMMDWAMKLRW